MDIRVNIPVSIKLDKPHYIVYCYRDLLFYCKMCVIRVYLGHV